jgi:NADPH-dependent 2,4-dienoyl-CoA reductase/sulfur reductase-like enzyme
MEAARVAALRGHRVTLAEAAPDLGGTLRMAAKAPTRHSIGDILSWLESEIYRLGVEVRLSTYVDAADVRAPAVEALIVATGSTPRMDGIQGSHPGQPITGMARRGVLSSVDLFMTQAADLGRTAVVIDDVGHYEGLAASEYLVAAGLEVVYVTRQRGVAPLVQLALMNEPFLTRMQGKPFRYLIRTRAIAIESDAVVVGPVHLTDDTVDTQRLPAETVVFISNNRPNREIYTELSGRIVDTRLVGDANSPRFLETAIREGHIAGASI